MYRVSVCLGEGANCVVFAYQPQDVLTLTTRRSNNKQFLLVKLINRGASVALWNKQKIIILGWILSQLAFNSAKFCVTRIVKDRDKVPLGGHGFTWDLRHPEDDGALSVN